MVAESPAVHAPGEPRAGWSIGLTGVGRSRADETVIADIDLEIEPGVILAVVGESGCGASTLARIIAGRERPDSGDVRIDGRLRPEAPRLAGVFDDTPAPRFGRAREVVARAGGRRNSRARDEAERLLAVVGLVDPDAPVRRLSRGDRQRLALACALASAPPALVLDDALSALHTSGRERLRESLVRELRARGTTTVWVTRDTPEAISVADRIAVMYRGRIAAEGTPEEVYARAGEPAIAAVLGPVNAVPGIVEGVMVDVWGQELPLAGTAHDGHCEVIVRPENVLLVASDAPGVDAVVEESTFLGSVRRLVVRTSDGSLVRVDHAAGTRVDDHAHVRIALAPVPVTTRPLS